MRALIWDCMVAHLNKSNVSDSENDQKCKEYFCTHMSTGAFFAGLNMEIRAETVEALPPPGADADGMAVRGSADPRPARCCGFLTSADG